MPTLTPDEEVQRIFRRTYLGHLTDQRAFDRELSAILRDAARESQRILANGLPDGAGVGERVRRAQAQQALNAMRRMQSELYTTVNARLRSSIEATTAGAVEGLMEVNALLGEGFTASVRDSFLSSSRYRLEVVRSRLVNDIPLSRRVYKTKALSDKWVERAVNRGILQGKSAAEIARDVRTMISPNTPGGVRYAAQRLARTELNNAFHTTTVRASQAPWIEGMKWYTSGSHPRPDECDEYATSNPDNLGEGVYKPSNVPGKPHPQCLCWVAAVTVSREDFVDSFLAGSYDSWLDQ